MATKLKLTKGDNNIHLVVGGVFFMSPETLRLEEELTQHATTEIKTILIDLQACKAVDGHGFGILAQAHKLATEFGISLAIIGVNTRIWLMLEICRLTEAFEIYSDNGAHGEEKLLNLKAVELKATASAA